MKRTTQMMLSAAICMMAAIGTSAAEKKAAQPLFRGNGFECKAFDRYANLKLTAGGKLLINGSRVYAVCKGEDGKNIGLAEKTDPKYQWKDNVLSQESLLIPRNAKDGKAEPYAKISRKISFSPDKIEVGITVKNLKDLTFAKSWQGYGETVFVVTGSVIGMRLDGIKADGQKISTVIPRKYDKKKWGFNKYVKALTMTDSEKFAMTAAASPNCNLLFNNYGGKNCELSVRPSLKQSDLDQKAGQETKFGYTITFGKAE